MPVNVNLNGKDSFRPPKATKEGQDFVLSLDRDIIWINNSPQKDPTNISVIEKRLMDALSIKGVIQKVVDSFHHQSDLFYIEISIV